MQPVRKVIAKIIDAAQVDVENNVSLLNKPAGRATKDADNNSFINAMAEIIYAQYYITGGVTKNNNLKSPSVKSKLKNELNFINELKRAYVLKQSFDFGWTAIERDNNGTIYVQKYDQIMQLKPGQFIKKENSSKNYNGKNISVYIPELKKPGVDYFYFVRGNAPIDSANSQLVRFYFNLYPKGASFAIAQITSRFNKYGIPFLFKCCSKPSEYTRTDSAVLYIENCYFNISVQLLKEIVQEMKPFLKITVPLFALKLCNGFSFAENPSDGNSFGMSRALLIANGLGEAIISNLGKNVWLSFVMKHIKISGFNETKMFLNPGSAYPYDFSIFADEK